MKTKLLIVIVLFMSYVTCAFSQPDLFSGFSTKNKYSQSSSNVSNRSQSGSQQKKVSTNVNNLVSPQTINSSPKINKKIKRTKKENTNEGYVATTIYYEDGSSLRIVTGLCKRCRGKKICYLCNGHPNSNSTCIPCNNTGKCNECNGNGRYETQSYANRHGPGWININGKFNYVYYDDVSTRTKSEIVNGNNSTSVISSSSSHEGNAKKKCSSCNGTGVCTKCHGQCGSYEWVLDVKKWMDCAGCSGKGRCPICYGRGYF